MASGDLEAFIEYVATPVEVEHACLVWLEGSLLDYKPSHQLILVTERMPGKTWSMHRVHGQTGLATFPLLPSHFGVCWAGLAAAVEHLLPCEQDLADSKAAPNPTCRSSFLF